MSTFKVLNLDGGAGEKPAPRLHFGELLESSRLSRLPKLPRREPCENCERRLDPNDDYQMTVRICRECLRHYANICAILERHTERKIKRNRLNG